MNLRKLSIILIVLLTSFIQSSDTIVLDNAIHFSADRYDNIYFVNENQDVKKLGHSDLIYSSPFRRRIDHIEAWNSIKIFLFSKEFQQYTLLDRYITEIKTVNFNTEEVGFAGFATIALDGNIWVIDYTDFTLKKIDIVSNKLRSTTNLNLIIDQNENEVLFMKEYGNFLYISTVHNGILVFDNMGTFKKKLPYNNVDFFSFSKNELYFIISNELVKFNTLNLSTQTSQIAENITKIILSKDKRYVLNK